MGYIISIVSILLSITHCESHTELNFERIEFSKYGTWINSHYMDINSTGLTVIVVKSQQGITIDARKAYLNDDEISELQISLGDAEFYSLDDRYEPEEQIIDLNEYAIRVVSGVNAKSVRVHGVEYINDMPSELEALIAKLENIYESILGRDKMYMKQVFFIGRGLRCPNPAS